MGLSAGTTLQAGSGHRDRGNVVDNDKSSLKWVPALLALQKTLPDRLCCSPATFFAKCKSKKTHKEVAETMGAGGQDSTAASGPSAPVVHCRF